MGDVVTSSMCVLCRVPARKLSFPSRLVAVSSLLLTLICLLIFLLRPSVSKYFCLFLNCQGLARVLYLTSKMVLVVKVL